MSKKIKPRYRKEAIQEITNLEDGRRIVLAPERKKMSSGYWLEKKQFGRWKTQKFTFAIFVDNDINLAKRYFGIE